MNGYNQTLTELLAGLGYTNWQKDNLAGLVDEYISRSAVWQRP